MFHKREQCQRLGYGFNLIENRADLINIRFLIPVLPMLKTIVEDFESGRLVCARECWFLWFRVRIRKHFKPRFLFGGKFERGTIGKKTVILTRDQMEDAN